MEVDLGKQTDHSPLWNGARRASMDVPGAPVDGLWTPKHVQLIWSQTGSSDSPEPTDDQPCRGGSSRELQHHWRTGRPSGDSQRIPRARWGYVRDPVRTWSDMRAATPEAIRVGGDSTLLAHLSQ